MGKIAWSPADHVVVGGLNLHRSFAQRVREFQREVKVLIRSQAAKPLPRRLRNMLPADGGMKRHVTIAAILFGNFRENVRKNQ